MVGKFDLAKNSMFLGKLFFLILFTAFSDDPLQKTEIVYFGI